MRTNRTKNIFRLLVGIGLVTLTANLFGQLFVEERLLCLRQSDELPYTAIYLGDHIRVDSTPTVIVESRMMEEMPLLETWMTIPFERGMAEENLWVESWMTIPFEKSISEENLQLESWMKIPFESDETIEIEDWMTGAWI